MATIYCDAAPNTVRKVVNRFGRIIKIDNGGYRVGVLAEGLAEAVFYNTRCPDQFAAECYSVLKAVEVAGELELTKVTIRNDRIGSFSATKKRRYIGTKYLYVAKKLAEEKGLSVEFEFCESRDNKADRLSRANAEQGIRLFSGTEGE